MVKTGARAAVNVGGCEVFEAETRLIVAPAPGSFEPAALLAKLPAPVAISQGQVIGHITGSTQVSSWGSFPKARGRATAVCTRVTRALHIY